MNVLHVIDSAGLYGAERMLLDLMTAQKKQSRITPLLCSIEAPDEQTKQIELEAKKAGIRTFPVKMRRGLNLPGANRILQLAHRESASILHAHGYKPNILLGLLPRPYRRLPLVCTLHGWTSCSHYSRLKIYEILDRALLRYKDAVVLVNKNMLTLKQIQSAAIPRNRLHVIENGIDIARLEVYAACRESRDSVAAGEPKSAFTIGAIGRLSREKAYDDLLRAVSLLKLRDKSIKVVIVGEGDQKKYLQALSRDLDIERLVTFTGYVDNAARQMVDFDVLVISSLTEGLPIVLLEAMYMKKPVISTRVGGIPDVIVNGESGLLIPPHNPDSLAEAIVYLMEHPETAARLTDNAYRKLVSQLTSKTMAKRYNDVYQRVCPNAVA